MPIQHRSSGTATARRAPDGHTHTGPSDPGYPYARDSSFRPFPPGPNASCRIAGVPYFGWENRLPQTMWQTGVPPAYQEAVEAPAARLTRTAPNRRPGSDGY